MKKVVFLGLLAAAFMVVTSAAVVGAEPIQPKGILQTEARSPDLLKESPPDEKAPVYYSYLLYHTIDPTRCINTKNSYGIVPAGWQVDFILTGCGVPWPDAKAAMVNIAAFDAWGMGNLRAFAYGDAIPFAATLNFGNIPGLYAISNAAIIPLCGGWGCAYDMSIWVSNSCNFVVDAMGYFTY